jgi:hypothetical protein
LNWIVWTTQEKGSKFTKFDILTGVTVIQPIDMKSGSRFYPVYSNDMEGFNAVAAKMKSAKVRTQEWDQRNADNDNRKLICVAIEDLRLAHQLIENGGLTPLPDLHLVRRVA